MTELKMVTTAVVMVVLLVMPMFFNIAYAETEFAKPTQQLCEGRYYNGTWTGTDCIEIPDPQKEAEWEVLKVVEAMEAERIAEEWKRACMLPGSCTFIK